MTAPDRFTLPAAALMEKLGECGLHFLWQGCAIACVLAALLWICRHGTAELRHALCRAALLVLMLAPVITWHRLPTRLAGPRIKAAAFSGLDAAAQPVVSEVEDFPC
jgi:hypothetical protein